MAQPCSLECTDAANHNTPHEAVVILAHYDRLVGIVLGDKHVRTSLLSKPLDHHFAVHSGDHDRTLDRYYRTIDHQYIAGEDTGTFHRVATHSYEKGRGRILHDEVIDVERALDEVVRWRRETRGWLRSIQRHLLRRPEPNAGDISNGCFV